jgi:hypothetical protein
VRETRWGVVRAMRSRMAGGGANASLFCSGAGAGPETVVLRVGV